MKKQEVITELEKRFLIDGFKYQTSKSAFTKKIDYGEFRFYINFQSNGIVKPDFAIRFDIIEEMRAASDRYINDLSINTIYINPMHYKNEIKWYFNLNLPEAAKIVPDSIIAIYQKYAYPYFLNCSNLPALNKLLNYNNINAPISENKISHSNILDRIKAGCAVAKLLLDENYNLIILKYSDLLTQCGSGMYLEQFEKFISNLDTLDIEALLVKFKYSERKFI